MRIHNIINTSKNKKPCACGSFIEHWKTYSGKGRDRPQCSVKGCTKPGTDGAHVRKVSDTDRREYIVPMCKEHNQEREKALTLRLGTELALASPAETCEKGRFSKLYESIKKNSGSSKRHLNSSKRLGTRANVTPER